MVPDPFRKVEELGEDALDAVEHIGEGIATGIRKLTRLAFPVKEGSAPLKRSMTGYETEMFVLDASGRPVDATPLIKAAVRKGIPAVNEACTSVIEVLCLPHKQHRSTSRWMLQNLLRLNEEAEKLGLLLYPYGTYPGTFTPRIRSTPRYDIQKRIFGDKMRNALLCCGYHQHYTLPRGAFDTRGYRLHHRTTSKVNRTLIDSHNFLTAADPALTCFLQSSPFVQGKALAKDSRLLLYRDGHAFGYKDALYYEHPILARLGGYHQTAYDLRHENERRYAHWGALVRKTMRNHKELLIKRKALSYNWGPLKVNPKGTLEYRGPDMNLMSNTFAVSAMITYSLRRIQQEFTLVTPTDMEIEDAFRLEGNVLFIPPERMVRETLQRASAYDGFANKDLHTYCRRFYRFIHDEIEDHDEDALPLLRPIRQMLDERRTVSDEMRFWAKKRGYKGTLPDDAARELAIHYAERYRKDLERARHVLERAGEYD